MVCPSCGLDNDPSATRCARCNASLTAERPGSPEWDGAPEWSGRPARPGHPAEPAYTAWPDQPSYVSPSPAPGRRSPIMPVLLALGVVLLLGVIVAGVVYVRAGSKAQPPGTRPTAGPVTSTGPGPTTPTTGPAPTVPTTTAAASAHDQAAVIDSILDRSAASRAKLNNAIDRVRRCTGLSGAVADLRAVGVERHDQIAAVAAADLSAVGNGEAIRSALTAALGFSLGADQHFVGWAQPTLADGCGSSAARTAAWNGGEAVSQQATAAKKQFLAVWNPVAGSLGLAERSSSDI